MSVLELNRIINQYDPPKDLHVGGILNLRNHRADVTRMLHALFGDPEDNRWTPIGSRKEIIEEAINNGIEGWKTKGIKVVRMKHSSGNNPAPEGLYLAQDNGPSDVVSNPRFLITPASVLDTAGKTKKGPNIVNVISRYKTLPQSYINDIGMNNIITNGISMIDVKNNYRVTIPVTLEEENSVIVENFSKDSFVPQELNKVRPSYFAGNREKNARIRDLIGPPRDKNVLIEGEKYILCKELGDTLQVQWLNYIFEQDPNITRSNTVIGTTDEVVLWRSIVNKVGVIYTNSLGQTRRYLPVNLSPEETRRINAQRIKNIRDDLFAHNTSVIALLYDIIMKGNKIALARQGTTSWIENITWNLQQLTNAVNFLSSTGIDLVKINNTLFKKFRGDSDGDVETAKQLANTMRFTNPFVKYRTDGTYKIITSTNEIYPGYPFRARRFLPSSFNAAVLQIGGSYEEMMQIINNKVARRLQNQNQNIDRIESILSKNSIDPLFLFCFIREFFPELFTYAYFMKVSFLNPPIYDNNIDFYDLKQTKQEYSWEDDVFKTEGRIYSVSSILEVLEYARLFIELFPDFRTEQLEFLFSNLPPVILPSIRDSELDYAATIAISLYEPYYLEELKSSIEMDSTKVSFFVTTTLYDISEDDEDIFSYARKIYNEKTKNPRKRKVNEDFTGNDEISEEFIENDESESESESEKEIELLEKERLESNIKRAEAINNTDSFSSILPSSMSFNENSNSKELIGISEPSTKAHSAEVSMNNTNDSNTSQVPKRRSAFTKIRKINTTNNSGKSNLFLTPNRTAKRVREKAINASPNAKTSYGKRTPIIGRALTFGGGRRTRRKNKTRR